MTPAEATRPVLILIALSLSGCGAVDADPHRFQALGEQVAALDIPLKAPHRGQTPQAAPSEIHGSGLRPGKFSPVTVSVMSPVEMWDARDAQAQGLRDALKPMRQPAPLASQPTAVGDAGPRLRPVVAHAASRSVQLGAYSSEAAARAAWGRLEARADLAHLSPAYETVRVGDRLLTRLKVGPISADQAANLCQAAQVSDPWCRHAN